MKTGISDRTAERAQAGSTVSRRVHRLRRVRGWSRSLVAGSWLWLGIGSFAHASPWQTSQVMDAVWAGHPVGFSLVAHRGFLFAAYYDAERRMSVASRAPGSRNWLKVHPEGTWNERRKRMSNVVAWDSHNSLVLVIDRDGILHLSGNMHVDPLVYYRSRQPLDITTLQRIDRMTGEREERCTYPVFFTNAAGTLFFRYRDGSSGRGSDLYNVYEPETRAWRRLLETPLHDGEDRRNVYATAPIAGPDGRFHLLWMWRHTPDAATNHALTYVRSADLVNWEDARGRPVSLPITFGRGDLVDGAAAGEGLINTTFALGFDCDHRPVAVYHRYDEHGHSQLYAARPTAEGWERRSLTQWTFRWAFGGGGSILTDVYVHRPRLVADGFLLVPFGSREAGDGVLRVDPVTLTTREVLPPAPAALPAEWMRPVSTYPGMQVRTRAVRAGNTTYVLRWETLPANRDRPRTEAPPPSELRLFEVSGAVGDSRPADR
jgi:hypothetical protein